MKQKFLKNKAEVIRWKRFTRKGYAVFASLGREIVISTLSVATLSFAVPTTAQAQTSTDSNEKILQTDTLPELEVTATKLPLPMNQTARIVNVVTSEQIQSSSAQSVNDLLKFTSTVDVRQRGAFGIQTDVSVNGGTHDQCTFLLNGVNISSPQSGHLSVQLPVSLEDISRIEILEGAASRVYGSSAFSGAINIITKKNNDSSYLNKPFSAVAHLEAGSFGSFGTGASFDFNGKKSYNHLNLNFNRSDGGTHNSQFEKYNAFYNGGVELNLASVDWQLGALSMDYGANTFYSGKFPNQYEQNRRFFGTVNMNTKGRIRLNPTLYFNRAYDHYQLVKHSNFGENYHLVDVYGASVNASTKWKLGTTLIGADFRNEGILSTSLGKPLDENQFVKIPGRKVYYTKKDNRTNVSYFLEHDLIWNKFTLSAGLLANMNTSLDYRYRLYPGVDLSFRPSSDWNIYASWNMAQRMPTFTDLYYKSPTQEGNTGLKPEKTNELALAASFHPNGIKTDVRFFYRHQKNMIDWIMTDADSVNNYSTYHATNFKINNWGFNVQNTFFFRQLFNSFSHLNYLTISYSYLHQKRLDNQQIYASSYALDYLRHKLVACLNVNICPALTAELSVRFQDRMGEYIMYSPHEDENGNVSYSAQKKSYSPYALLNAKICWKKNNIELYVNADNITSKKYYDIGNVRQPGLWVMTGAKIKL